jgi:hypothetical protein
MTDNPINRLDAEPGRTGLVDDLPDRVRRRYLTEAGPGRTTAYFTDATTRAPAFRDDGRRLATDRNDPKVVGDLLEIARHRGWAAVQVRGETRFRREVWLQATALGLEVKGYRPTERDRQEAARRRSIEALPPPRPADPQRPRDQDRLRQRVVETVVEARVRDPEALAAILASARQRIAGWLERSADPGRPRGRDR